MTTYLGKSCSFGLPRVPFVNCCQFMYFVISLLGLRAGCGIWLYQFLIIVLSFYFNVNSSMSLSKFYTSLACKSILTVFVATENEKCQQQKKKKKKKSFCVEGPRNPYDFSFFVSSTDEYVKSAKKLLLHFSQLLHFSLRKSKKSENLHKRTYLKPSPRAFSPNKCIFWKFGISVESMNVIWNWRL